MKFARGFFTCILIILASHGAYQVYKQHFKAPFQVSDDVRKELQSAGIHLEEMAADENGVTNLFSDSGHFGTYCENAHSSTMPPSFLSPGIGSTPTASIAQLPPPQSILPTASEPALPYADSFAPPYITPESPAPRPEINEIPVPAVLPPSPVPEQPGMAVSTPHQAANPIVPGENVTKSVLKPDDASESKTPSMISDGAAFSNIVVMSGVRPNDVSGMSSIMPSPIMIDKMSEETESQGIETSAVPTSVTPDDLPLPDGFAVSGKKAPTEEILPVSSMSSIRQFDTVTPLPSVLEENDKTNIAGDVRQEIVSQCQAILPMFDSQDTAKIKDGYIQLSRLYFNRNLTPEEQRYVAAPLSRIAGGLFFSNQTHILEPPYLVKEGESMESIAADLKVTPELLWKINGFALQTNLQPGMQIKVIRGPLEAKVKPNTCELIIMSDGHYVCRFKIGVGLNYAGQRGTFSVQDKTVNPTYDLGFGLDRIEAGDPNNPLGCRWIKLSQTANNIGIHGTNRPDLIGVSDRAVVGPGVFFMKNEDVVEVCDMLIPGSTVVVER